MAPPAPGLFSITTGCLICAVSLSATTRESTSVGPPAGNGTTIRTGFTGQSCALAAKLKSAAARTMRVLSNICANGSIGKKGDPMREISALVFDAYGTLFDVHSVTRAADSLFPGKGAALSAAWRTKQLE